MLWANNNFEGKEEEAQEAIQEGDEGSSWQQVLPRLQSKAYTLLQHLASWAEWEGASFNDIIPIITLKWILTKIKTCIEHTNRTRLVRLQV